MIEKNSSTEKYCSEDTNEGIPRRITNFYDIFLINVSASSSPCLLLSVIDRIVTGYEKSDSDKSTISKNVHSLTDFIFIAISHVAKKQKKIKKSQHLILDIPFDVI